MSNLTQEQQKLSVNNPIIKEATIAAFQKIEGVKKDEIENFIEKMMESVPAPIPAKADLIFGAIYGSVTVKPTESYKNCVFDHSFWGVGAVGGSSIGVLYTAYDSWGAFFSNVTAFHAQSYAEGGGILQVNFFIKNGTPVGQYNGAMAGAGAVEGGNSGKWKCS